MNKKSKMFFYDRYHKKNNKFKDSISANNFTYFYILSAFKNIKFKQISTCLDLGCGVGAISFYLSKLDIEIDAVDISPRAIQICNEFKKEHNIKNVHFYNSDVQLFNKKMKYDLIVCCEVIEHLENDVFFVKKIKKYLKPDGYLILSTPSLNSPLFRLGLLNNFDKEVGHIRRYSLESLVSMIRDKNLKLINAYKVESLLRNLLFTNKFIGKSIRLIRGRFIAYFHVFDELLTKMFGESDLIVIFQKKAKSRKQL